MKKLDEIDLLKLKSLDLEAESLVMTVEIARNKAQEANAKLKNIGPKRNKLYSEMKKKYEIADQFTYDRETGEIIENRPATQLPSGSHS